MSATKCRSFISGLIVILLLAGGAYGQTSAEVDTSRVLVVGTKHVPPFAIKKPDGGWEGISIELWKQVADELSLKWQPREFGLQGLLEGLEAGSIDAGVAALTITAEREQTMDFTHPFQGTWIFVAAFSREEVNPLDKVRHRYGSFNRARDALAHGLDFKTNYKIRAFVSLNNAMIGDSKISTGDHDTIAVLLRTTRGGGYVEPADTAIGSPVAPE